MGSGTKWTQLQEHKKYFYFQTSASSMQGSSHTSSPQEHSKKRKNINIFLPLGTEITFSLFWQKKNNKEEMPRQSFKYGANLKQPGIRQRGLLRELDIPPPICPGLAKSSKGLTSYFNLGWKKKVLKTMQTHNFSQSLDATF